jgi:hypothetical protein
MPVENDAIVPGGQKTLLDLAAQLQAVSQALVAAQQDSAEAKAVSREAKAENQALRVQLDSQSDRQLGGFRFKHVGNELNYTSNLDGIAIVSRAGVALQAGRVEEIEKLHHDVIRHMKQQNKLIKLADGSPAGWGLIVELQGTEVAEDQELDRRIKKAEQTLEIKYKRKLETDARNRNGFKRGPRSEDSSWDNDDNGRGANHKPSQGHNGKQGNVDQKTLLGPCFFCRGPHMRKFCPELAKETAEVQAKIEAIIQASRL